MTPVTNNEILLEELETVSQPSKTYYLNLDNNTINGFCDDIEAIKQTIYCILNTERFENLIYSWNYGVEIKNLIGENETYVIPELERVIREALLEDDRITDVSNFSFETSKTTIVVSFEVSTIIGNTWVEKVVTV
ncbi:MAG: DUF2634 domain-containing protein [Clostridia bacterium]|nr:DUF2634 domain-containing protein [Clostridia bacterium]